jgi:hypothetical protein
MQVTEATEEWPEHNLRERAWFNPAQAVNRIEDKGLKEIIRAVVEESATVRA